MNGVAPGPIADTPGMAKLSGGMDPSALDAAMTDAVPIGRAGTKQEVANACLFLLTNEFVSGSDVVVDGGNWLMKPQPVPRDLVQQLSKSVEKPSRDMGIRDTQKGVVSKL